MLLVWDSDVWHDNVVAWDERAGRVSRSFDEWKFVDKDIRAFLSLTANWARRRYEEIWNESERDEDRLASSSDVNYYNSPESFEDGVEELPPGDYQWILYAATIKEAVTAFEVYLEKGLDEVLARRLRARVRRPFGKSPRWDELVKGHQLIEANVSTERVQYIRALRHILTHQRGELRTEAMRARFAADYLIAVNADTGEELWDRAYIGGKVQLTRTIVDAVLDDLGITVREVDSRVWAVAYGRASAPALDELRRRRDQQAGRA
jgi:hypothetical protein